MDPQKEEELNARGLIEFVDWIRKASIPPDQKSGLDGVNADTETALTVADKDGRQKAVEFLANSWPALKYIGNHFDDAILLIIANKNLTSGGSLPVGKYGAQLNANSEPTKTIQAAQNLELFVAVECQNTKVVDEILKESADINARDGKGQAVLFRATRRQDASMMRYLITSPKKIRIDIKDDLGRTAWSANVQSRNKEILDILMEAGADPSTHGFEGINPLHKAAQNGVKKVGMLYA